MGRTKIVSIHRTNFTVQMVYRDRYDDGKDGVPLLAPSPLGLKVIIVGTSIRRCKSDVCEGLSVFQIRSAVDTISDDDRALILETAPRVLGRDGVDAVYVV